MGYALIKDINGSKGYALNRLMQNLIPVDDTKWVYINKNSVSFSYKEGLTIGTYVLESVDLGSATQPYLYELVGNPTGASINPISGFITLDSTFEGNSLTVKLQALYNVEGLYYPPTSTYTNEFKTVTFSVSDQHHVPAIPTYTVTNIDFAYSSTPVAASGGSSTPTLTYVLNKTINGETSQSSESVTISYSAATIPTGVILNGLTGKITFLKNNDNDLVPVTVQVTIVAPDGSEWTDTASVSQNGRQLNGIEFYTYDGNATIEIGPSTTIYAKDISLNLVYDTGSEILTASESNGILIANGSTGTQQTSLTFDTNGNYTIYIYYAGKVTTQSVVVSAIMTSITAADTTMTEGAAIGQVTNLSSGGSEGTMEVTANYSDGSHQTVTATVSPGYVVPGTYQYTATYKSFTTTFTITATDLPSDVLVRTITVPSDAGITPQGNALTVGHLSHSTTKTSNTEDGGSLVIGSDSTQHYREHYCTYGTTKKYYLINPHPPTVVGFVLEGNKVSALNSATTNDSFTYIKRSGEYIGSAAPPVLVIFNPGSSGNTLYLSLAGSNDIDNNYVVKECIVN